MKKWMCLISVLCLLMTCAAAEEYVTIAELREQAKAGWNETYQTKSGEQTVNAEMGWFPEDAQTCPLFTFDFITVDEADPRLDKWRESPHSDITIWPERICVTLNNWRKFRLDPNYTGKLLYENKEFFDGDPNVPQAEECDITYEEFLERFEEHLNEMTGISMDDVHLDRVTVSSVSYKTKKVNGEVVRGDKYSASGGYVGWGHQLAHRIPVYGAQIHTDTGILTYRYDMEDYWDFVFAGIKEKKMLEEDLPLLSFDDFTGKLGKLIEAGEIRDVLSMRFGYGTCKDGDVWKVVPVWVVDCTQRDDINEGVDHYFNAQTGEWLKRYSINWRVISLPMPKILTWDDVK